MTTIDDIIKQLQTIAKEIGGDTPCVMSEDSDTYFGISLFADDGKEDMNIKHVQFNMSDTETDIWK